MTSALSHPSLPRRPAAPQRGFSLVEILVATVILVFMMMMVWGVFSNTIRAKERVDATLDRYGMSRLALERMSKELASAWIAPQPGIAEVRTFETAFRIYPDGGSTRLDFVSFSHTRLMKDVNETDQAELSYWVAEDPATGTRGLWRREAAIIDDRPAAGGRAAVVVTDVVRFDAVALDVLASDEGDWVEEWDTTQASGFPDRLPRAVRMTLTFLDEQGEEISFATTTRLFMESPVCRTGDIIPTGTAR